MHSAEQAAQELAEKLASRDRHVVFLLGAGASCAAGLPSLDGLKLAVAEKLAGQQLADYRRLSSTRNIEDVLTRLRQISEVLDGSADKLDGFDAAAARALDAKICTTIAMVMQGAASDSIAHARLAQWLALSRYSRPIEVFTTNYDLLIEGGLEKASVPYFDGFVGVHQGRFRDDLVDESEASEHLVPPAGWIRVWKLHGSVSWTVTNEHGLVSITRDANTASTSPARVLAIYPSARKYQESRRIPFVVLADRFRRSLSTPKSVCLVSGYSFGDQHINDVLFESTRLHPSSELVVLSFEEPSASVKERAKAIPNLTLYSPQRAIIGGVDDNWKAPSSATSYWNTGFLLGDFAALAAFLSRDLASASTSASSGSVGGSR